MIPTRLISALFGMACGVGFAPAMGQYTENPATETYGLEAGAEVAAGEDSTASPSADKRPRDTGLGADQALDPEVAPGALDFPDSAAVPGASGAMGSTQSEAPGVGHAGTSATETVVEKDLGSSAVTPHTDVVDSGSVQDEATERERQYRDRVLTEADASLADTQQPATGAPKAQSRVDRIRGIVSEAVVELKPSDQEQGFPAQEPQELDRRTRLIEAVSSAPEPENTQGDAYVSTLREEGSKTVVIDVETAKQSAVEGASGVASPVGTTVSGARHEAGGAPNTYTVRAGDSLWRIAQHLYGDGYRYVEIFKVNQDVIGDENLLIVGQVLRIPVIQAAPREPVRD